MPGPLEQGPLAQHRGVDVEAAVLMGDVLGQTLQFLSDRGAGR